MNARHNFGVQFCHNVHIHKWDKKMKGWWVGGCWGGAELPFDNDDNDNADDEP